MVHLRVINPNTTAAMTDALRAAAVAAAGLGVRVDAVQPGAGPAAIESDADLARAAPAVLELIEASEATDADGSALEPSVPDGYVVACFGDPGVRAARSVTRAPVIGLAEGAMHAAALLGRTFSVVTTLEETCGRCRELVDRYGMGRACRAVRATGLGVLELADVRRAAKIVGEECWSARDQDGCDSIVLGCAGMAGLAAPLTAELGLPVIDGVAATTLLVGALARLRARPRLG